MEFYARVGDEVYLLLDKSFEDAVVTFWFWTAVRTERGEIPPGTRVQVTELALAYQRGVIENAEVATLPVLEGEALRRELKACLHGPVGQATINGKSLAEVV